MKHLIDTKDFTQLEKIATDRGTSLTTIMKSYNIQRINKYDDVEPEPEPEPEIELESVAQPKSIQLEYDNIEELSD